MLKPDQVEIADADGSTCVVCDAVIDPLAGHSMISFRVKVLLATIRKSAHISCVEMIWDLLGQRLVAAKTR